MLKKHFFYLFVAVLACNLFSLPEYVKTIQFEEKTELFSVTRDLQKIYVLDQENNQIIGILDDESKQVITLPERIDEPIKIKHFNNKIYILDAKENQIVSYDIFEETFHYFDKNDSDMEFSKPIDFAINQYGAYYVLDEKRSELMLFSKTGLFLNAKNINHPKALSIGKNGKPYVICGKKTPLQILEFSSDLSTTSVIPLGIMYSPEIRALHVDNSNRFLIADDEKDFFAKIDAKGEKLWQIGTSSKSNKKGYFYEPFSVYSFIETDEQYYYFLDQRHSTVQIFKEKISKEIAKIEEDKIVRYEVEQAKKYNFQDMIILNEKTITINKERPYLSIRTKENTITALDKEQIKKENIDIDFPTSLASDGERIFISDAGEHCIHVLDMEGNYLESFAEKGKERGKLLEPCDLICSSDKIYVLEKALNRISVFSTKGIFQSSFEIRNVKEVTEMDLKFDGNIFVLADESIILEVQTDGTISSKKDFDTKIKTFCVGLNDIPLLFLEDNQMLQVGLEKNALKLGCKGKIESENDFAEIHRIYFDQFSEKIYLSEAKEMKSKLIQVYANPKPISDLTLSINEEGKAVLSWTPLHKPFTYKILKRKKESDNWKNAGITKTASFELPIASNIYEISVVVVSESGLESELSSLVKDAYSYGVMLYEDGNLLEAINIFKTTISLQETFISQRILSIYQEAKKQFLRDRDFEKALFCISEAMTYSSEQTALSKEKIKYLKILQRYDEAINFVHNSNLENDDKNLELMKLHFLNRNFEDTILFGNQVLAIDKNNETVMTYCAKSYNHLKDYVNAQKLYAQLSQSGSPKILIEYAKVLLNLNQIEAAIKVYTTLVSQDVENPEYNYLYAKALFMNEQFSNAERYAQKASTSPSPKAKYFELYGKALRKTNKIPESIEAFKNGLEQDSTNVEIAFRLAKNYRLKKDYNKELEILEKVLPFVPNNETSKEFHLEYAEVLMKKTNFDNAVKEYEFLLGMFPNSDKVKKNLEKAKKARLERNKRRKPIEVATIAIPTLYPALLGYYESHPIGNLKLFNTKDIPVTNIQISIESDTLFAVPFYTTFPSVLANETEIVPLEIKFNNSLIEKTIEKPYKAPVLLTLTYHYKEEEKTDTQEFEIAFHQMNASSWNDKKQIAVFVNPNNQTVRQTAVQDIVNRIESIGYDSALPKAMQNAITAFQVVGSYGIRYISDPNTGTSAEQIDFIQTPIQTLSNNGGDCDDLVILMANILESIGISTAYIDVPGHVIFAFDIGLTKTDLETRRLASENFIFSQGHTYVPVEATLIGKASFQESWQHAKDRYHKLLAESSLPEIINFQEAHSQFEPTDFPVALEKELTITSDLNKKIVSDIANIRNSLEKSTEEILTLAIKKYPENPVLHNRIATFYIAQEKYDEAKKHFQKTLNFDENNIIALNNLANIYVHQQQYDDAEKLYIKAIDLTPEVDNELYVNMTKLALKMKDKKKARKYLYKIDIKYIKQNHANLIKQVI